MVNHISYELNEGFEGLVEGISSVLSIWKPSRCESVIHVRIPHLEDERIHRTLSFSELILHLFHNLLNILTIDHCLTVTNSE